MESRLSMDVRRRETEPLQQQLARVRGDVQLAPQASIVVPVNAAADLARVLNLAADIAHYDGRHSLELILVINNYDPGHPPVQVEQYQAMGFVVVAIPTVIHEGAIAVAARRPGIERARSNIILQFDADCRIPNATALMDWYIGQIEGGVDLAYTHVDYADLPAGLPMKIRMFLHHGSRWVRRALLGIPTSRGSNYAIRRALALELYGRGVLQYDIVVGPLVKSLGGRISYSGAKDLTVLTSGRFFQGSWNELVSYFLWRVGYYRRVGVLKSKGTAHD